MESLLIFLQMKRINTLAMHMDMETTKPTIWNGSQTISMVASKQTVANIEVAMPLVASNMSPFLRDDANMIL